MHNPVEMVGILAQTILNLVDKLKVEVIQKDNTINTLKDENEMLVGQINKLLKDLAQKETEIAELRGCL